MNKEVYVGNLPFHASEPELNILFSKAGDVMSVKIVADKHTGQPRGIAFVEVSTQWEARRPVSTLNRTDFIRLRMRPRLWPLRNALLWVGSSRKYIHMLRRISPTGG